MRRFGRLALSFLPVLVLLFQSPAVAATVSGLPDLGRAGPATIVRLGLRLPYQHEGELDSLIAAQGDPRSPYFRRYLTAQQFDAYFGSSAAQVSAVQKVLAHAGFAILPARPSRQVIHVVARAPIVDQLFATETHLVVRPGAGTRYASAKAANIPAALRGRVAYVDGFSNVSSLSPPRSHGTRLSPAARPMDISPSLVGPDGGFGMLAEAQAYDFPLVHGFTGDGWTVASVTGDHVNDSDVATYLRQFHQKRTGPPTENIDVDGGCYRPYGCDYVLPQQDAESIVGAAPGVRYLNYVMSSTYNATVEDAFDQIVAENRADVVNFSLGECETNDPQLSTWINAALKRGTAQGQTFVFASGANLDGAFGAYGCSGQPPMAPTAPATGQYDFAVGGGDVVMDGARYVSETGDLESGGGVSTIFPVIFQRGIPGVERTGRNIPDLVAAASIDGRGPSLYVSTYTGWVGGFATVEAGPIAGFLATLDQMVGARAGHVGHLYSGWKSAGNVFRGKTLFHDITSGCNGIAPYQPGYCAHSGYDRVTGIGSIDGFNLAVAAGGTP